MVQFNLISYGIWEKTPLGFDSIGTAPLPIVTFKFRLLFSLRFGIIFHRGNPENYRSMRNYPARVRTDVSLMTPRESLPWVNLEQDVLQRLDFEKWASQQLAPGVFRQISRGEWSTGLMVHEIIPLRAIKKLGVSLGHYSSPDNPLSSKIEFYKIIFRIPNLLPAVPCRNSLMRNTLISESKFAKKMSKCNNQERALWPD